MKSWFAALALLLAAPALAATQPQDISQPGTVPHVGARAGFPERVGDFERVHVLRYGENDLSGNYDLHRGSDFLRLSVYIYPAPRVPAAERAAACRETMSRIDADTARAYPDAEVRETREPAALAGTEPALRHRTLFRLSMRLNTPAPIQVRRENRLYCYVGGDWLVKFYASSNADFDVEAAIEAFIRDGPWPGRGVGAIALR
jgi:hypothetical protein